jgi:hypothetical protein
MPATWSSTSPTDPGLYWLRDSPGSNAEWIEVERDADGLAFQQYATTYDVRGYAKWHPACQWSGPLTPPE